MKNPLFLVLYFYFLSNTLAYSFSEDEFENIVRTENTELKALYEAKEALKSSEEEAELIYGWQAIGGVNKRIDKRPSDDPNFTYDSMNMLGAELGVQKVFSFGLETKLLLNSMQTKIDNGNAGVGNFDSTTWETLPSLELKLPLLSGGLGRKVQADYRVEVLRKKLAGLEALILYDNKMNEAKTLLWSTILQKELVASQEETLNRIKNIYEIVRNKKALNLEATSNFLQTRSALELAELELKNAQLKYGQYERLLKLVLNKVNNLQIPNYNFKKFNKVKLEDFINNLTPQDKLISLAEDMTNQSTVIATELNRSRLDLIASVSLSGQNKNWDDAINQSRKGRYPTQFIGLSWVIPLDQNITTRAIERQSVLSKTALAKKTYFQTDQRETVIKDLVEQTNQLVEMLALNLKLEKTQSEKLKNERTLLNQGRSSIYQVLQFELDFARAQTTKFSLALELEKNYQQLSQYRYNTYE